MALVGITTYVASSVECRRVMDKWTRNSDDEIVLNHDRLFAILAMKPDSIPR